MPTQESISKKTLVKDENLSKDSLKKSVGKTEIKGEEKIKRSEDMSFFSRIRL
jgi:hypothetical protein